MSKIELNKSGQTAQVKPQGSGEILIRLQWSQGAKKKALVFSRSQPIDLDLGCFFELADEKKAVIHPLNNGFLRTGSYHASPWIYHTGDDQSGATEGEFLKVNPEHWNQIKRILVFAYLYDGAPRWSECDGVVTVAAPGSREVEVRLGQEGSSRSFCAVAMLENAEGDVKVTKLVTFHDNHPEADAYYGWGLRWEASDK